MNWAASLSIDRFIFISFDAIFIDDQAMNILLLEYGYKFLRTILIVVKYL